jgi:hypothetical protein
LNRQLDEQGVKAAAATSRSSSRTRFMSMVGALQEL